jgi:zinc/manganese transport system permease protein
MNLALGEMFVYNPGWLTLMKLNFMQNALLGGTIVAVATGLIGYFVILRHASFAAHSLAHIGLPGATGAILIGAPVTLGLFVFCTLGSLFIGVFNKKISERDIATGTILAFATGLGMFFANMTSSSTKPLQAALFGNLLGIDPAQIKVFALMLAVVICVLLVIYRPLLFATINTEVAYAKGVKVQALSITFMVLLALVTTMSIQVVGTLLIFALLITPAASAIEITAKPYAAILLSVFFSLFSVWAGLFLSAMFPLPPSFIIVSLSTFIWLSIKIVLRINGRRS